MEGEEEGGGWWYAGEVRDRAGADNDGDGIGVWIMRGEKGRGTRERGGGWG